VLVSFSVKQERWLSIAREVAVGLLFLDDFDDAMGRIGTRPTSSGRPAPSPRTIDCGTIGWAGRAMRRPRGPPVPHRDLHEDVFGRPLAYSTKTSKYRSFIEHAGVEQFVLEVRCGRAACLLNQIAIGTRPPGIL